jgi:hypothetical protein
MQLEGLRFGKLLVIGRDGSHAFKSGKRARAWKCLCDCGRECSAYTSQLTGSEKLSCGCRLKHGHCSGARENRRSVEYTTWVGMKARCEYSKGDCFASYGGRGIYVCERWRGSFGAFLHDMGSRPSTTHSLDRINNDGSYTCGKCDDCVAKGATANCRWATRSEQSRNTSRSRMIEHNGESMCVADWAKRYGQPTNRLWQRLVLGWPMERALTEPSSTPRGASQSPAR